MNTKTKRTAKKPRRNPNWVPVTFHFNGQLVTRVADDGNGVFHYGHANVVSFVTQGSDFDCWDVDDFDGFGNRNAFACHEQQLQVEAYMRHGSHCGRGRTRRYVVECRRNGGRKTRSHRDVSRAERRLTDKAFRAEMAYNAESDALEPQGSFPSAEQREQALWEMELLLHLQFQNDALIGMYEPFMTTTHGWTDCYDGVFLFDPRTDHQRELYWRQYEHSPDFDDSLDDQDCNGDFYYPGLGDISDPTRWSLPSY